VFEYAVYGLAISSDVTLHNLERLERPQNIDGYPRVRLRLKPSKYKQVHAADWFHSYTTSDGRVVLRQAKVTGGYLLSFPELADFFVSQDGREVRCCWPYAHDSLETICHLALDQVLPCVANLVGLLALHATAVGTPHGVCAFVGSAGTGKSTIAASFGLAGYPTFCDDCLVVTESGRGFLAEPGYPGVRLWEDSARSILGTRAADHPMLGHYTKKRGIRGLAESRAFPRRPTPLVAIYILARDVSRQDDAQSREAPTIEEISARECFARLLRSTYRLDLSDNAMLSREFQALHSLVERVPVRALRIPSDFDALPAARDAVLADLTRIKT
jgi:hypothetical protein